MSITRAKYVFLTILSSLVFASCNYLDFDETNNLKTKEDMHKYSGASKSVLVHVHSYMPQGYQLFAISDGILTEGRYPMRDRASDDGEFGAYVDNIQDTDNGNWSPIKTYSDSRALYHGIRTTNSFIVEIAQVDFIRYEHDGQYINWMEQLKYSPYEARVLRAHCSSELARRYGNIAIPLEVLAGEKANTIGKTPLSEVISFTVSEYDGAANNLPDSYVDRPGVKIGRVTKGFTTTVKSKALLYATSKPHNPSMDIELWKKSAKAAIGIINTGPYSLDPQKSANNLDPKEVVLMRINGDDSDSRMSNLPSRMTTGTRTSSLIPYSNHPSRNPVDALETVNGYKVTLENIGWVCGDPAFDLQSPYENRDKRFYRVILVNGMSSKDYTIETFKDGADDGIVSQGDLPTEYFLRKYIQEATSFEPGKEAVSKHHWVVYRYAGTLLAYTESMVNVFNDVNYTDETYRYSAPWAINEARKNANMSLIPLMRKEDFFECLYNEWRIESTPEDHRFWDVRRWKIADTTRRELYGAKTEKQADSTFNFYKNLCETRDWRDCVYLHPIPQNGLYKDTNLNPQSIG